jgi:phosphodiester glycosidase/flagellar hook capping protein FlgD
MLRRVWVAVSLTALALPAAAIAATSSSEVVPGITYTREDRSTRAGPMVIHVLTGPAPGGLYALKPTMAFNRVTGRETVSAMQRRMTSKATTVGINGDFFGTLTRAPSGIFMRNASLAVSPQGGRSALGFASGGWLRVDRVWHASTLTVAGYRPLSLTHVNRGLLEPGITLFTPSWGSSTPVARRAVDVVLKNVPKIVPEQDIPGTIVAVRRGGGTTVRDGRAVLQARGRSWTRALLRRAEAGRAVSIRVDLRNWWRDVGTAMGGGPLLVQNGVPVLSAGEAFTSYIVDQRHPRTAVGQLADGRIILLAVDGRSWRSIGMRTWELAEEMARRGAVTAMAFDGGGSTTMAFDGSVLNRPSDGSERPVADALMYLYYGIYATNPRYSKFSPNGDGVADVQSLSAKIVRPSTVDLVLVQPDGAVAWRYQGPLQPSTVRKRLTSPVLPEGKWRWIVYALDGRGRESLTEKTFQLNNTLGYLRVSKTRMAVAPGTGGRVMTSVQLTNDAKVAFSVRNRYGTVVRRLFSGTLVPGTYGVFWNGKNDAGRVVAAGTYTIRADASNELGRVNLRRSLLVLKDS